MRAVIAVLALLAVVAPAAAGQPDLDPTCVENPQVNTGRATLALRVAGEERAYFRYVPASYEGVAMPVVVNLHDEGSSAVEQVFVSGLDDVADQHGFVTLTPLASGTPAEWTPADVALVEKMLDATEQQLCVDRSRVYVTGLGQGADPLPRIEHELADRVTATKAVDHLPFDAEAVWSDLVDQPLPSEP